MQRRRTRTDSTEDSESSSSSPHNSTTAAQGSGGATDGWQHTLQSAAVSAAIVSSVAAVTAESAMVTTAQPAATSKSATVRRIAQRLTLPAAPQPPPAASAASLLQHRRIARRLAARRRQLPRSLRDLASSDESAQDADDEASASAGLNDADRLAHRQRTISTILKATTTARLKSHWTKPKTPLRRCAPLKKLKPKRQWSWRRRSLATSSPPARCPGQRQPTTTSWNSSSTMLYPPLPPLPLPPA
ncbi:hypothetical protein BOX15_Mlig003197g2 [Macrostomum lignano]|uniref:Uncharacterized protein n=1 Tax=Macrostomum lignano TaxID=282301 RepID=A0A267DPY7_9PLAT|nr:hypothetical protein BOX15_Mlig003197g2 [Macrostomum lignano]